MSFDEQPDGDPHGECAAEIHRLESERNDYKARALSYEAANMEQGKLLNEVIAERDELLAALSCAEALFDRKWNGVVGSGCEFHWHPVGNWRHYTCKMTGETFIEAIAKSKP